MAVRTKADAKSPPALLRSYGVAEERPAYAPLELRRGGGGMRKMEADKREWKGVTMRFPKSDYQQYADAAQKLDVPKTKFIRMAIKLLVLFTCLVAKGWEVKLVSPKGEEKTLFFAELALDKMVDDKQAG